MKVSARYNNTATGTSDLSSISYEKNQKKNTMEI